MKANQLAEILAALPLSYSNANVYIQMEDQTETQSMDPSLLQDVDEFVIDLEDDVIILRTVNR